MNEIQSTYFDIADKEGERQALDYLSKAFSSLRDAYDFNANDDRIQKKILDFILKISLAVKSRGQYMD